MYFLAVECDRPPHPSDAADSGGYKSWDNIPAPYPTQVEYRCHTGRRLVDDDGFFHDSQTIQCQWNKQWSSYNVMSLTIDEMFKIYFEDMLLYLLDMGLSMDSLHRA